MNRKELTKTFMMTAKIIKRFKGWSEQNSHLRNLAFKGLVDKLINYI